MNYDESLKSILRSGSKLAVLAIANAISLALLALFWLAAAALVRKEVVGELSFLISSAAIGGTLATMGLGIGEVALFAKNEDLNLLSEFNGLAFILGILSSSAFGFLYGEFVVVPLIVFSQVSFTMTTYNMLSQRQYGKFALWTSACSALRFIAGFIGIIMSASSYTISALYMLPALLMGYDFVSRAYTGIRSRRLLFLKLYRATVISLSAIAVLRTFASYLDKILVGFLSGVIVLGEYQFVYQIYAIGQFLPSAVLSYSTAENAKGVFEHRILYLALLFSVLASFSMFFGAAPLIHVFFPAYETTVHTIQVVSFSVIAGSLSGYNLSILMVRQKNGQLILSYLASIVIQYSLIIVLSSSLGLLGIGIGLLAGQIALAITSYPRLQSNM